MATNNTSNPPLTVSILSMGTMGGGLASLLTNNGYKVLSNLKSRSGATLSRAELAGVTLVTSDIDLLSSDIIISIVPPAAAYATAQRIAYASTYSTRPSTPQYYLDLNASTPALINSIKELFEMPTMGRGGITVVNGQIFGPPPEKANSGEWKVPRIIYSSPIPLPPSFEALINARRISDTVGDASTVKMCFSSLTKGLTALALQSFATAEASGVSGVLKEELAAFSSTWGGMENWLMGNLATVPSKAWRWDEEMRFVGATHRDTGFPEEVTRVWEDLGGVYGWVSKETGVGRQRKVGVTGEDVVESIVEAVRINKEQENEEGEQQDR
ncbi:6-phosphogluconate dehydrogenase [Pyronema omphalodes]|nr:6-phosphogluconate dehydrogenase [Pyronema omphalodes]